MRSYPEGDVGPQQGAGNGGIASGHDHVHLRERHVCQVGPDQQRSLSLQAGKTSDKQLARPAQAAGASLPPRSGQATVSAGDPRGRDGRWGEAWGPYLAHLQRFHWPDNTPVSSAYHIQAPH